MFVKPGENPELPGTLFRVRVPHTLTLLAEAGQEVPDDMFWRWMLRHGDVVEVERPAEEAGATALTITGDKPAVTATSQET